MDFKHIPAHISTVQWLPSCIGDKSILVGEIEPKLYLTQWNQKSNLATIVMLDFMSTIRLMSLGKIPNKGAAIYAIITSASYLSQVSDFIHIVLASYIEM